jgi:hypothetical protein
VGRAVLAAIFIVVRWGSTDPAYAVCCWNAGGQSHQTVERGDQSRGPTSPTRHYPAWHCAEGFPSHQQLTRTKISSQPARPPEQTTVKRSFARRPPLQPCGPAVSFTPDTQSGAVAGGETRPMAPARRAAVMAAFPQYDAVRALYRRLVRSRGEVIATGGAANNAAMWRPRN